MIPFFQVTSFALGPFVIQAWGLLVSLGAMSALALAFFLTRKFIISSNVIFDLAAWALVSGLLFSRLFYIFFYAPDYYLLHPGDALRVWTGGFSSLGGFFGGFLAAYLFAKFRRFSFKELLPYLDVSAVSLWLGWGIGRLGCFLIHDHPGRLSHFFLAVNFPSGARHDLGLYDALLGLTIFTIFSVLFTRLAKIRWGLIAGLSFISYAVVRFFLDFLRATDLPGSDIRYAYFTPAQWGMIAIAAALTLWLVYSKVYRQKNSREEQSV